MRLVLPLVFLLVLVIFAWTFVGDTTPDAQWSDIQYVLRDVNMSDAAHEEIRRILYRSRRDWLVARWLSGAAALVIAVAWGSAAKKSIYD